MEEHRFLYELCKKECEKFSFIYILHIKTCLPLIAFETVFRFIILTPNYALYIFTSRGGSSTTPTLGHCPC